MYAIRSYYGVAATLYNYVPTILGSLALLVVGWIVATLLRSLTFQIASRAFERLARTRVVQARLQQSRTYRATPTAISRIVFWGVVITSYSIHYKKLYETGPKVARFENDFRSYKDADHAVAVNSCTAALHLSILAAGRNNFV